MFKNMTPLERTLAMALVCLVPLGVILFGVVYFNGQYQLNKSKIAGIEKQISDEQKKQMDGMMSRVRKKFYYLPNSFPSGGQQNISRYQDWLLKLQRECGFPRQQLQKPQKDVVKFKSDDGLINSVVGHRYTFKFDTKVTLDQVLKFCYEFERMNLLHKIKQLNLTPVRRDNKELTGECKCDFVIEVLALSDADESTDFGSRKGNLAKAIDDYKKVVVSRNIFGPANNPPSLRVSKKNYYDDEEISYTFSGRDKDDHDLTYEFVGDPGIEGATLEPSGSTKAKFKSDPLPVGDYNVKIRVTDSGFPAKSFETDWQFAVKERPPKPEPKGDPEPEPKEPFKHAGETRISRISSRDGEFQTKIKVLTTGQIFELKIDDQFELDDENWVVRDISPRMVKLESAGKLLEYRMGNVLTEPLSETELEPGKATESGNESTSDLGDVSASSKNGD